MFTNSLNIALNCISVTLTFSEGHCYVLYIAHDLTSKHNTPGLNCVAMLQKKKKKITLRSKNSL